MVTRICDRCGQPLEEGALRYVAKIQVFAAYDPLEISFEDLMREIFRPNKAPVEYYNPVNLH